MLLLAMVLLLFFSGLLYLQQPSMIFFPSRVLDASPASWGLDYEDVQLMTEDRVELHGWYLPYPGSRHTVLFFHGNAGNISHRGDSILIFHRLGLNVLIFDYRGYGQSEGRPTEEGLYRDAWAAWKYLIDRGFSAKDIVVFGRSLGGTVAARLASEVQPAGLILESSFSSARDLAHTLLPLVSRLTPLRFKFNAARELGKVNCPVLVAHSKDDEIIPYVLGEKLYQAAKPPKRFMSLRGDHNAGFILSQPGYEQGLADFLSTLVFPATQSVRHMTP